jgi:Co/Zn/Cd efflux system component
MFAAAVTRTVRHPVDDHNRDAHDHAHSHDAGRVSPSTMATAGAVTLGFVVAEAAAGWMGHSLALLSDAGHNLADTASLGLSWYALWIARKPSHDRMTYGYHRMGIVAALINSVSLALIALWIVREAIARMRMPEHANGPLMIGVAISAIVVNVAISARLHEGSKHDMNVRSAYVHMMGDAVSAFGVVFAGLIVAVSGNLVADPIVSLLIAGFVVWSSYGVFRDSRPCCSRGRRRAPTCRPSSRRSRTSPACSTCTISMSGWLARESSPAAVTSSSQSRAFGTDRRSCAAWSTRSSAGSTSRTRRFRSK